MISLTIFICFNFRFNPNLLGNNAIARIFEHCGLMNRFGFNLIYQVKGVLEVNLTHKSVYQQYQ